MAGFSSKKTSVVDTFRNTEGQTVKIIKVNGKSAYEVGSRSHQGYILEVDGQKVAYTGNGRIGEEWGGMQKVSTSESSGTLISWGKDNYGDDGIFLTESEYKAKKEGLEAEAKMKKEIQAQSIMGAEAMEKTGELAKLEASQNVSTSAKILQDALLASGASPAELSSATSKVVEDVSSVGTQMGAQTEANVANLLKEISGLNLGATTTGENVETNLNQLYSTVQMNKDNLANSLKIAKEQAGGGLGFMDILGSALGTVSKTVGGDILEKAMGKKGGSYMQLLKMIGL